VLSDRIVNRPVVTRLRGWSRRIGVSLPLASRVATIALSSGAILVLWGVIDRRASLAVLGLLALGVSLVAGISAIGAAHRFGQVEPYELFRRCLIGLATLEPLDEALESVIERVCEFTGWVGGDVFVPTPTSRVGADHGRDLGDDSELREILAAGYSGRAVELSAGRVWRRVRPQAQHTERDREPRVTAGPDSAASAGVRPMVFPVLNGDHPVAVLVFRVQGNGQGTERLVTSIETLASQLGAMIERRLEEEDLRKREALSRAILSAMPDLMTRLSPDGILLDYRPPSGDSPFYDNGQDNVGRSIRDVLPPAIADGYIEGGREALRTGAVQVWEYKIVVDGLEGERECRIVPLEEFGEVMVIIRDITGRKQAEARLEQAIRSKDQLIASVSHEIRTPLTAVLGFSELLLDESMGGDGERRDAVLLVARQARDMSYIVEDLLVAARAEIDSLRVAKKLVSVCAEINQVTEAIHGDGECLFGIDVRGCHAIGDPGRIRQILRNLMTNALKYGGPVRRIEVDTVGDVTTVAVSDNGPAIPCDEIEKMFEPYERAEVSPAQPGSVGLGLTVSRALARLMGGDVAYAYVDGWSTFSLTLPAAPSDSILRGCEGSPRENAGKTGCSQLPAC
jgi:signal transduction histidine kinase